MCLSVLLEDALERLDLQPRNGATLDLEFKDLHKAFELGEHISQIWGQ